MHLSVSNSQLMSIDCLVNNMSDAGVRKIWVELKRLDLEDSPEYKVTQSIQIREDYGSDEIRSIIKETFQLHDDDMVLKLRNHRGSLMPISCNIASNSKSVPYSLEVVHKYQNVKPKARSVKRDRYNETMKRKITEILARIEKLENATPELRERQNKIITTEMEELEKKLGFLTKRFHEADNTTWKGMFKKNPFW
ncbi:uncharacterized protein LOC117327364 isoform X1 [Pecten maximus]|uniref:uncharacterized protein LOC117327364 isoform X1 n=1 Tax=Pecten maximus TaxID=6579 RepID=UPI0014590537|nr:uncharacterized protein LOC117327364 isoform X1 [Pecten maximus]